MSPYVTWYRLMSPNMRLHPRETRKNKMHDYDRQCIAREHAPRCHKATVDRVKNYSVKHWYGGFSDNVNVDIQIVLFIVRINTTRSCHSLDSHSFTQYKEWMQKERREQNRRLVCPYNFLAWSIFTCNNTAKNCIAATTSGCLSLF